MELLLEIAQGAWKTFVEMAPYLLFGFAVAGILSVAVSQETVERHMGGRGLMSVLNAALIGVPLPLCSCGVIPVAASLRKHGASRGATIAFLASTPQTGVDSILVTYGLLGPVFAVFRPVIAFLTGLAGGWLVDALDSGDDGTNTAQGRKPCTDECCAHSRKRNWLMRALRHGFVVLPRDIGGPLMLGVVLAGLIAVFVPPDFFAVRMGQGIWPMFAMMLIGIPLYVCATASVPIAVALIMKGISPGAALVFLITGPATNVAAIATIWKMLGKKTTIIYLLTIAVTAIGAGLLLDSFVTIGEFQQTCCNREMLPGWVGTASAIALTIMLLATAFHRPSRKLVA